MLLLLSETEKDIKSIEDMKGKSFVANYESAFHGYRIGMADLAFRGYDPDNFLRVNDLLVSQPKSS